MSSRRNAMSQVQALAGISPHDSGEANTHLVLDLIATTEV